MKSLDEKSVDYSNRLQNQTGTYTKGEIETAYVVGASENMCLQYGESGNFGQAIASLKQGQLITRKGWNGKGMFLFLRPEDELSFDMVVNKVKSLPEGLKNYVNNNRPINNIPLEQLPPVKFTAYICMKAADGTIVNGWLASQTDILSDDWMIFEP